MRLVYNGQKRIHRDIGKKSSEDKGRDLSDAVTSQRSPGTRKGKEGFSKGMWAYRHLDFFSWTPEL